MNNFRIVNFKILILSVIAGLGTLSWFYHISPTIFVGCESFPLSCRVDSQTGDPICSPVPAVCLHSSQVIVLGRFLGVGLSMILTWYVVFQLMFFLLSKYGQNMNKTFKRMLAVLLAVLAVYFTLSLLAVLTFFSRDYFCSNAIFNGSCYWKPGLLENVIFLALAILGFIIWYKVVANLLRLKKVKL